MKTFSLSSILIVFSILAYSQSNFQLIRKTVIGGEGGWDYLSVDAENRRLYISHSTQVEVLDVDTHAKIGAITGLNGVHGVIAVPKTGRGITTNGRSNTATIFDLKTLKVIAELSTGKNPDALLYDDFSKRVFIFNHSDVTVTVVDVVAAKVVGTLDVGATALEAGVTDGNGTIFVNLEDSHEIVSFDAKTLKLKNRWKLSPGEEPTGLAIDVKSKRLFAACHNEMMIVVDTENGAIIKQVPIGKRVDGAAFDAAKKLIFTSNGEGTITVIREESENEYTVVETIATQAGARTIALDPTTHHLFVTSAQYGDVPPASAENPHPRPAIVPGTFTLLEFGAK